MTKQEIYILLKHQLQEQSEAQVEAFGALEQKVLAVMDALAEREPPQDADMPHVSDPDNPTIANIFRNHPSLKVWLIASGIDNFARFKNFRDGLSPDSIAALIKAAEKEGY